MCIVCEFFLRDVSSDVSKCFVYTFFMCFLIQCNTLFHRTFPMPAFWGPERRKQCRVGYDGHPNSVMFRCLQSVIHHSCVCSHVRLHDAAMSRCKIWLAASGRQTDGVSMRYWVGACGSRYIRLQVKISALFTIKWEQWIPVRLNCSHARSLETPRKFRLICLNGVYCSFLFHVGNINNSTTLFDGALKLFRESLSKL